MSKSIIKIFMEEHSNLLRGNEFVRGLYLRKSCSEFIILECEEWKNQRKTFVFEFDCGYLESCKTEINTMEKYLSDIPESDYAEYVSF